MSSANVTRRCSRVEMPKAAGAWRVGGWVTFQTYSDVCKHKPHSPVSRVVSTLLSLCTQARAGPGGLSRCRPQHAALTSGALCRSRSLLIKRMSLLETTVARQPMTAAAQSAASLAHTAQVSLQGGGARGCAISRCATALLPSLSELTQASRAPCLLETDQLASLTLCLVAASRCTATPATAAGLCARSATHATQR